MAQKRHWTKSHHELHEKQKKFLPTCRFLLMVSGGADSVAALKLWSEVMKDHSRFAVFHYHHGSAENQQHRDQSRSLVQEVCQKFGFSFYEAQADEKSNTSEACMRQRRYAAARSVMATHGFHFLVTAHHQEDLLETRLIRLIRGTGSSGLSAIKMQTKDLFRPWLQTSQRQLHQVLHSGDNEGWEFLDDPSNFQTHRHLRNWIRHEWLPRLERFRPGSSASLSQSLSQFAQQFTQHRKHASCEPQNNEDVFLKLFQKEEKKLDLSLYLTLKKATQKRTIARIYQSLGQKNYTSFGVIEVVKQLDKTKEGHRFKVQGLTWYIAGRYVMIKDAVTTS